MPGVARARGHATAWLRRLGPAAGVPLLAPLAAATPLWAVSALTRSLRRVPWLEPDITDRNLVEFMPEVGARPRPHLDTHSKAEDVFRLRTDADGRRGLTPLDQASVVVIGDSFAFGYGVDDDDLLTERMEPLAATAVASPAYSMVHGLLWMRRLASRLANRHVVWLVYLGNDLTDNLYPDIGTYRMPFVRQTANGWDLVTDHVREEPWSFQSPPRPNLHLLAEAATPGHYSDRVFGAADFLLGQASRACADAGVASLTVMSVPPATLVRDSDAFRQHGSAPARVDPSLPDRRLEQCCHAHDIDFLPLRSRLRPQHYFVDDMHWNAAGHRLAADAIRQAITPGRKGRMTAMS